MKTFNTLFLVIVLVSCGDNLKAPDANSGGGDGSGSNPDSQTVLPDPPAIGPQVDRMGRPAINTALDHTFDATASGGTAKDNYNKDEAIAQWPTKYPAELAKNLAILDALDTGLRCVAGTCSAAALPYNGDGCGTQVEYNNQLAGVRGHCSTTVALNCDLDAQCPVTETCSGPAANSYLTLATVLADDELYLDTTKNRCRAYLAYEFHVLANVVNIDCGGRAPTNDVMDTSYTALAIGINGFNMTNDPPAPFFGDGVAAHADVHDDVFPFLGAPH